MHKLNKSIARLSKRIMSNEITWTSNFSCTNGAYSDKWSIGTSRIDQGSQGASAGIMSTSTSAANVPYGSVSSVGWLLLCNIDASHNIDVGINVSATFEPFATLLPGENAIFRVKSGIQIQLQSQSGVPNCQFWLLHA